MNAAANENTPALVIRGISDMCAGKDHEADALHQPIAAAHAAAMAFGVLSVRSKVAARPVAPSSSGAPLPATGGSNTDSASDPSRLEFVLSLAGTKESWSTERIATVIATLKDVVDDPDITLIRVDSGPVRLVLSVRRRDLSRLGHAALRDAFQGIDESLLGAAPLSDVAAADAAAVSLASASADLLAWQQTLPDGRWMERPEIVQVAERFQLESSSTVLLGEPGSGKSALLARIGQTINAQGHLLLAIKADLLPVDVRDESDLQRVLFLTDLPSDLLLARARFSPVFVLIDQLDALASSVDLKTGRLNVLLNLIRKVGGVSNVHVLLSARTFEFNHDVRLRCVDAVAVELALPPWHDVTERLAGIGVDAEQWPEKARDVIRSPQALRTFMTLAMAGSSTPFTTYQAMLERLWQDRIVASVDGASLASLASLLASDMAEEESLWLAVSRYDSQQHALRRLEALGFVVQSENGLSVAFSHQTVFDFVLARTFANRTGLLSEYVLARQDSLFVRPKLWSALNYLREAESPSYQREFAVLWRTTGLRSHLRNLLIEFVGQTRHPTDFERGCMAEVLQSAELRVLGLKSITAGSEWFDYLADTAIRSAMHGSDSEASQALRLLSTAWHSSPERVLLLIRERWLPDPGRDRYSWLAVRDCSQWTADVEQIALTILQRTAISTWDVGDLALILGVEQPPVAMRLVRAKLDFQLQEARALPASPPYPTEGSYEEKLLWNASHRRTRHFEQLLEASEWDALPSLAEAAPEEYLRHVWPWYVSLFEEVLSRSGDTDPEYIYPGHLLLTLDSARDDGPRRRPVLLAAKTAVEALARSAPLAFSDWVSSNSKVSIMCVQQLIAHGYESSTQAFADDARAWLLADSRRFQLGSVHGHRATTLSLVRACAIHWSEATVRAFESAVLSYSPRYPSHIDTPQDRRTFKSVIRATRKDILQAMGADRLSESNRALVATEQRALGNRFDRSMSEVEVGWIGSPMDATAMAKAKDRDILKIFDEIPDRSEWDHPTHFMRGGNIQLSRAFAEFARTNADRAFALIDLFKQGAQERAVGYALETLAEDASNDERVLNSVTTLSARGFHAPEFVYSASRAVEKIAGRQRTIPDTVIAVMESWLELFSVDGPEAVENSETEALEDADPLKDGSILWNGHGVIMLPSGSYNTLSALAASLLSQGESGRDRLFAILDTHFEREAKQSVWKAMLHRLHNAGGRRPHVVSSFVRRLIERFPSIVETRDLVMFLAYAQRWDHGLVLEIVSKWESQQSRFLQRSFGELVGLVSLSKETIEWIELRDRILSSGTLDSRVGLAHAAVNLWSDDSVRQKATETIVALVAIGSGAVTAAVFDLFRVNEDLPADANTFAVLSALTSDVADLSGAPAHFVIERLQTLLPHYAELVASLALRLVKEWRGQLADISQGASLEAPQLTDLALTLHRLGGVTREPGVAIFEAMIEIDAYGARGTLAEIDGRFGVNPAVGRRRLTRRKRTSVRASRR